MADLGAGVAVSVGRAVGLFTGLGFKVGEAVAVALFPEADARAVAVDSLALVLDADVWATEPVAVA